MIETWLLLFLKKGELGKFSLGMSDKKAIEFVKNAVYTDFVKVTGNRKVLYLNDLILSFYKGKLDAISLKFTDGTCSFSREIEGLPEKINQPFGKPFFLQALEKESIAFKQRSFNSYERDKEFHEEYDCYETDSEVEIYFKKGFLSEVSIIGK
jgi:hypothetical protein